MSGYGRYGKVELGGENKALVDGGSGCKLKLVGMVVLHLSKCQAAV